MYAFFFGVFFFYFHFNFGVNGIIKNMVYTDQFYGYFTNFPFILISASGRELSRNFFTLRYVKEKEKSDFMLQHQIQLEL